MNGQTQPADDRERPERYWFARHSTSIIFLICILAVIGVYEALTLPVAVFPTTNFPRIIIAVDNGVMPIEQMEVSITRTIEDAVRTVPGLENVRSITSRGSAEIDLNFNWSVDMRDTLQLVDAAVSRVQHALPPTADVQTHRLDFASFPIIGYSLTSATVPQTDLWELATYDIQPRLNALPGVASVLVQGGQRPEFHVTVDPAQMLRAKTSIADILASINRTNVIDSPGLLSRNHQLFLGLVDGQVHSVDDIGNIVIKHVNNAPVRVRDIGSVASATTPVYTVVSANGKPAVLVSVNRQPTSNTVEVADEVHREMAAIQPSLPAGVDLRPFYDQSGIVEQSIASVRDAIVVGLVLAAFIIWLFLRDWGTALMTGLVVPVTMVVTFIAMKLLGQSFNLMTLGGLAAAVGLVIDDAIVVVENIVMHRDSGQSRGDAIRSAIQEIRAPLVGSTITPIVVFLPLVAITGVTGTFFRALAVTVGMALLTSLALALSWTPTLSHFFIRDRRDDGRSSGEGGTKHDSVPPRIMHAYERTLRTSLDRPALLVVACLAVIVVAYGCYRFLGSDLLPEMDEGGFIIDYIMPAGSSLDETNRVLTGIEEILRSTPE
ncbi:MAG TPA: efflux RND transporter permease subunit, partial [Vicinamibacterales bacterium]|nr:efflux RND transporter permease subunit [Vicinamibacterales bacterium]